VEIENNSTTKKDWKPENPMVLVGEELVFYPGEDLHLVVCLWCNFWLCLVGYPNSRLL
jgi:hypothetical protein